MISPMINALLLSVLFAGSSRAAQLEAPLSPALTRAIVGAQEFIKTPAGVELLNEVPELARFRGYAPAAPESHAVLRHLGLPEDFGARALAASAGMGDAAAVRAELRDAFDRGRTAAALEVKALSKGARAQAHLFELTPSELRKTIDAARGLSAFYGGRAKTTLAGLERFAAEWNRKRILTSAEVMAQARAFEPYASTKASAYPREDSLDELLRDEPSPETLVLRDLHLRSIHALDGVRRVYFSGDVEKSYDAGPPTIHIQFTSRDGYHAATRPQAIKLEFGDLKSPYQIEPSDEHETWDADRFRDLKRSLEMLPGAASVQWYRKYRDATSPYWDLERPQLFDVVVDPETYPYKGEDGAFVLPPYVKSLPGIEIRVSDGKKPLDGSYSTNNNRGGIARPGLILGKNR
jgi:hypothetical protein